MQIWNKITNKNYYIGVLAIVLSLMLFENYVGGWITKYVPLSGIILSFVSMFLIVLVIKLVSEEVLD